MMGIIMSDFSTGINHVGYGISSLDHNCLPMVEART